LSALPFLPIFAAESTAARLVAGAGAGVEAANVVRGVTVLGRYPSYVKYAEATRANYFSIGKLGNILPRAFVKWLNFRYLDLAVARGDRIILSQPFNPISDAGSWLADEIAYLHSRYGYVLVDGLTMVPP
jgi:hypothetical protein